MKRITWPCLVAHWLRLNCVGSLNVYHNVTLWAPNLSSNISFNNTNSEYFCEETVVTIAFVSLLIQWLMLPFGILIVCLDMKYEPLGQIRNHSLQSRLQSTVNRRPNRRPNQQDYGTLITNPDENTISIETNPLP